MFTLAMIDFFFFKQKTAYEIVSRDWSSDVCSSDLFSKSLAIQLNTLGENYPDVAVSYNNIGIVYRAKGDNEKAKEYHTKSLAIKHKS